MEEKTQESGNDRKDDYVSLKNLLSWKIYVPREVHKDLWVLLLSLTNLHLHPKETHPFQFKSNDLEWSKILIPIHQEHFQFKKF